jgi:hypothetical protein
MREWEAVSSVPRWARVVAVLAVQLTWRSQTADQALNRAMASVMAKHGQRHRIICKLGAKQQIKARPLSPGFGALLNVIPTSEVGRWVACRQGETRICSCSHSGRPSGDRAPLEVGARESRAREPPFPDSTILEVVPFQHLPMGLPAGAADGKP